MKMKRIILFVASVVMSATAFAQYEGTYFEDRIGHGEDSIEIRQNVSLFNIAMQDQKFDDAYEYWKFLMEKAPIARLDTYTKGATMFESLIAKTQDKELKKKYLDELLGLYDTRLANADKLNACADIKPKTTRGPVLCRKAYDYAHYANGIYDDYTLDKAYDNFTEGINLVNEDPSIEIEAFVLSEYILTSFNKYKTDEDGFREQFLNDYILCKDVCEKMLAKANETEDKAQADYIVKCYDPTYHYVNQTFAFSNAATKDQVIDIYENTIENKKTDLAYLKTALRVMQENYCDDTDIYFKAAQYAYDMKPEYYSAIGMAAKSINDNNLDEALNYYNQAIELCENDSRKADIAYEIANVLGRKGQISKAEPYLARTEELNPAYKGKCDLYRARRDASEKKFDSAIAFANKAGEEDPSISGTATRLAENIADWKVSYAKYEEEMRIAEERARQLAAQQAKERAAREAQLKAERDAAKANQTAAQKAAREKANAAAKAEYDRKMAEYKKQKAAYDAQMARQKRLDDFWRGK